MSSSDRQLCMIERMRVQAHQGGDPTLAAFQGARADLLEMHHHFCNALRQVYKEVEDPVDRMSVAIPAMQTLQKGAHLIEQLAAQRKAETAPPDAESFLSKLNLLGEKNANRSPTRSGGMSPPAPR